MIRSLEFNVKQFRYFAMRVQTWIPNISLFIHIAFNFIFYGDFVLLCNRTCFVNLWNYSEEGGLGILK